MLKASPLFTTVKSGVLVRTPLLSIECDGGKTLNSSELEHRRTAIAIGSPSLFERTDGTQQEGEHKNTDEALQKYHKRMCRRATPYGLFAGVSWAQFTDNTSLERSLSGIRTRTRPDMSWLLPFFENLDQSADFPLSRITVYANPQLLIQGEKIWLHAPGKGKPPTNIKGIKSVRRALDLSAKGIKFAELCEKLCGEFSVTMQRAEELCRQLYEIKILLPQVRCAPVDWSSLLTIDALQDNPAVIQLKNCITEIHKWDALEHKSGAQFMQLVERVKAITSIEAKDYLQVDSTFDLKDSGISNLVANELSAVAEPILRLSTISPFNSAVTDYLNRFVDRYQPDREVPILELLNPMFGLGSPYQGHGAVAQTSNTRRRDAKLIDLLESASRKKSAVLELSDTDIHQLQLFSLDAETVPSSIELFASIAATSRTDIDQGEFELVMSPRIGDIGGGRSVGRFGHILGEKAIGTLQEICAAEQRLSASLLVDINYNTPSPRLANVAISPNLRGYCINVNTAPSNNVETVPISEICIGIDNQRFYARWSRTGQKIEARSNNLLNPLYLPEIIRFLLDIREYGLTRPAPFDWGLLESNIFLPRVKYRKTILALARWRIGTLSSANSFDIFKQELASFRRKHRLPHLIQLTSGVSDDAYLFLNLEIESDCLLLFKLLKKQTYANALALEYIPLNTWHTTPAGTYATELVASLVRSEVPSSILEIGISQTYQRPVNKSDYLRLPGSEWLYLQLDCSHDLQEDVILSLNEAVKPLSASGAVQQWFFLRYYDRFPQLRLRFCVDQQQLYYRVLPALTSWLNGVVDSGLAKSYSIQSYDREVERYGGVKAINLAEQIFCIDSLLVSDLYTLMRNRPFNKDVTAVITINNLLNAFGLSVEAKIGWLKTDTGNLDRSLLSQYYRQHKELLHILLTRRAEHPTYEELMRQLEKYDARLRHVADQLKNLEQSKLLGKSLESICQSLIHVHCVRLFGLDRSAENKARALLHKALISSSKRR